MKKIAIIFSMLMMLAFTACSYDNSTGSAKGCGPSGLCADDNGFSEE